MKHKVGSVLKKLTLTIVQLERLLEPIQTLEQHCLLLQLMLQVASQQLAQISLQQQAETQRQDQTR